MTRVLLTGARAPVTLDLARRFHDAGHAVFLADSLRFGLARFSRAVTRMSCVASPRHSTERYIEGLLDAVERWQIDLLIPTCEEVYFIARHRDRFQGRCKVFTDSIEKLERVHNKWKFSQARYSNQATAPESHYLTDVSHLQPFLTDATNWVFKPAFSRFASDAKIGPSADIAATIRPTAERPWIAQRRVLGQEFSTYSIARHGRLLAHVVYRSAYRVGVGAGIYFVACEHPGIDEFVRDFLAAEEYTGQIGFDFIVDAGGRTWVLEANPRATSGVHLFAPEDRLIAAFLLDALSHNPGECIRPSAGPPAMLGFAMAIWGLAQAVKAGNIRAFVRDCRRAREVVFQWRDPLPALLMPLATVELIGVASRRGLGLTAASTYDIEWNGE